MPRTEKSAAWSKKNRVPDPRSSFDANEAAELAVQYGPRLPALISDTLEVERALLTSVPPSFLVHMSFAAPPSRAFAA